MTTDNETKAIMTLLVVRRALSHRWGQGTCRFIIFSSTDPLVTTHDRWKRGDRGTMSSPLLFDVLIICPCYINP